MNISYRWLQAIAPTITDSPGELSARLGMLGAPVDELTELGAELGDVRIARVQEVRPHPNADRLRVCVVNAGAEPLQVVCGAPNVEAGRYYPFAPVGATLPGGTRIQKAKLRGEVSEGMLCSARELGLGRDHGGLMTLAGEFEPGAPLVPRLGLDDAQLVVDVTPNRPDLLSHLGVAREVAPGGVDDIRLEPFSGQEPVLDLRGSHGEGEAAGVVVRIEDPIGCRRYLAAVVRGVLVAPSPEWLATRLRSIGLRPINNVVDATNYVLHELGQPLHAFDLNRVAGQEIRVRRARTGETLRTLDGMDRALGDGMLVIADRDGPVALAGVMGGEESEVTGETRDLLIECALFDEALVRKTARGLGLSTDASYRFERGVDPELQPIALRRIVDLIVATAGGTPEPIALDVHSGRPEARVLELRPSRASRLLGIPVDVEEAGALLRPIGFAVLSASDSIHVRVPGFRPDVTREVDLIEEIARRRGYDSFPDALPAFRPSTVPEDALVAVQETLRGVFGRWGFLEARTASFAPGSEGRVPLLNPLSAEESGLRDALTPGLLRRLEHNWAHGVRDVRLYEVGTVFFPSDAGGGRPREEVRVAAVFTGARRPPHWSGDGGAYDLWDLKALLAEIAGELGIGTVEPGGASPLLDPSESFTIPGAVGEGWGGGGRIAGKAVDAPAWAEPVWSLEVRLPADRPRLRTVATYQPLPEHPPVERDLALLVPRAVAAAEVERTIRDAAGPLLEAVWPFDLYEGKGIEEGVRSLAWRLRFRHTGRTLTDAEVESAVSAVLQSLQESLGIGRR